MRAKWDAGGGDAMTGKKLQLRDLSSGSFGVQPLSPLQDALGLDVGAGDDGNRLRRLEVQKAYNFDPKNGGKTMARPVADLMGKSMAQGS